MNNSSFLQRIIHIDDNIDTYFKLSHYSSRYKIMQFNFQPITHKVKPASSQVRKDLRVYDGMNLCQYLKILIYQINSNVLEDK